MTHSARGMINKEFLSKMKKGSWLINTARGALAVAEDVAESLEAGHINYYGGDVWYPQPAPPDHPWRKMRNPLGGGNGQSQLLDHPDLEFDWLTLFDLHCIIGMVPHMSGTTLDAQARYAAGTKEILRRYWAGEKQEPANLIVENGEYATKSYGQSHDTKAGKQKEEVRTDGHA